MVAATIAPVNRLRISQVSSHTMEPLRQDRQEPLRLPLRDAGAALNTPAWSLTSRRKNGPVDEMIRPTFYQNRNIRVNETTCPFRGGSAARRRHQLTQGGAY